MSLGPLAPMLYVAAVQTPWTTVEGLWLGDWSTTMLPGPASTALSLASNSLRYWAGEVCL